MVLRRVPGSASALDRRAFLRAALLSGGAVASGGLLAACARPDADPNGQAAGPDADGGTEGEAEGSNGTLVFAVDALTGNSDPGIFSSFGNWMVIDCVARGLTHVDYESAEVQPALAESWDVSDDQLTYTFAIREGVTFHDGNPVRAQDFERSWNRLFDEDDPTRHPSTYADVELGGANVVSFQALDDRTFEVQLAEPDVAFLSRCSNPNSVAISEAAIEELGQDVGTALVGAGPFRFVNFNEGENVILERFEDYWEGAPEIEQVVFQILPDPSALVSAIATGAVNATNFAPVADVERLEGEGLVVADAEPYISIFVGMNMGAEALSDLRVRQAINLAIDRETIINAVFAGAAREPAGMVTPAELGHDEDLKELSTQDLERARELIAEAGAEGQEVNVLSLNILFWPAIGQVIEQNLRDIGLEPQMQYTDGGTRSDILNAGEHEVFIEQRSAFVADPDNKLTPLWSGDSFVNQVQTQHYLEEEAQSQLDDLLFEARAEPDEGRRAELYSEVQRFFMEEIMTMAMAAYIFLPTVHQPNVEGLNASALGTYRAFFEGVSID